MIFYYNATYKFNLYADYDTNKKSISQSRKLFIELCKFQNLIHKVNVTVTFNNWFFKVQLFFDDAGTFLNYKSDFNYSNMKPIWHNYFKNFKLSDIEHNQHFIIK